MNTFLLSELKTHPAVFAVKDEYQIMVPVKSDLLFWVSVNGKKYYDHSNGIIRSSTRIHRVHIPMTELDSACEYTVSYKKIIDRKPYFPETEPEVSAVYRFRPITDKKEKINIYHLSDTHGQLELPCASASFFGDELDLLILNGDIPDHSGKIENFDLIYELCSNITKGEIPCIFSRGNHDTRGFYAENIAEYTPTENGKSYFTVKLGPLWAFVMDCAEDKDDTSNEYGGTICCHDFRVEETEYFEKIIENANKEYLAPDVKYRLVIAHNPFTYTIRPPFDIEQELYKNWAVMLGETVKPQLMICGHLHSTLFSPIGGPLDSKGQICPVITGANPIHQEGKLVDFHASAISLSEKEISILFTDKDKNILESNTVSLI